MTRNTAYDSGSRVVVEFDTTDGAESELYLAIGDEGDGLNVGLSIEEAKRVIVALQQGIEALIHWREMRSPND